MIITVDGWEMELLPEGYARLTDVYKVDLENAGKAGRALLFGDRIARRLLAK